MPRAIPRDAIYRGRRYSVEVIEQCVRCYITYRLSYRDLVAMMAERRVAVTHTTIMRWVHRYVPEYEKRWARFARPVGSSWRMDETAVPIGGRAHYVYRAVDRHGRSVDSLLCNKRTIEAAQAFLQKAVARLQVQGRGGLAQSTWMDMWPVTGLSGCWARRTRAGSLSRFATAAT